MALRAVVQAARRFSAADLPIRRSATMSKLTFCPSLTCSCRAFNRADMNKDVTAAVGELNEAEALLAVKPLHSSCIHRECPFTDNVHVRLSRRGISTPRRLIDFGEGSETCAPVSTEAKRPSRLAKCRLIGTIWTRIGATSRSAGLHLADVSFGFWLCKTRSIKTRRLRQPKHPARLNSKSKHNVFSMECRYPLVHQTCRHRWN